MRIGFNARLLHSASLRGWNRYALNLLIGLQELGCETILYSDRPLHQSHLARLKKGSFLVRTASPMKYMLWEQIWLSRQSRKDNVEILHSPFHFGLPYYSHCPRVLTLHDAINSVHRSASAWGQPSHMLNMLSHLIARCRAHHVITVSNCSRIDISGRLNVNPENVSVIYEAADPRFQVPASALDQARLRKMYRLRAPYFFYVGGWEGRKNLPFLIRSFLACGIEGVDLILAGEGSPEQKRDLMQIAQEGSGSDRVKCIGIVPDEDLPALYAGALAFVYPSRYEGFGLQLCEAMSSGCPVFAARASCLPEILGEGGETFSLDDPAELIDLLRAAATDPEFRLRVAERGRQRSRHFDWRSTATQTLDVYRRLAAQMAKAPEPQATVIQ